jgi:alcohol dehydrogenase class IV
LIVTDKDSRDLPFIQELVDFLKKRNISTDIYCKISLNPRDDEIDAGRMKYISGQHDAIIAIGGGSAMDGAKAICLTANNQISLWDFKYRKPIPTIESDGAFPILITIPTTAGTGAETESTAMITNVHHEMKYCLAHPKLKPALALLDPKLTVHLPSTLTAWTGVDALTHAIEAYLVESFHPLCDGAALEGLALVTHWLPTAVREPHNLAARGGMLVGSCLAGVAFLKGLGLIHAISHMIGAEFNTQHGLTNAIILPVILRYNLPGMEHKVDKLANAMGLEDRSVNSFISEVENLLDEVEIPRSLKEIGVPMDCADRIANKAAQDSGSGTNPRAADIHQIKNLVNIALTKAR